MPKVSICIPAYKQAEYLKKSIDSILSQTFTDFEVIITDDSKDDKVEMLVKAYNLPNKIKYFKNSVTLGSPGNWNQSILKATGEYIKILHHDDWLNFDDSLAKYVALLDNNPKADFAFSATKAIHPNGTEWLHEISLKEVDNLRLDPLSLCLNNIVGAPSTTIVRNNSMLNFDILLKWHVDIEYYIRQISENSNIAYSKEALVVTFIADGRVSDECFGNEEIEVFEYFYLLDKLTNSKYSYSRRIIKECLLKAITICKNFEIKTVQDIRKNGYKGKIPFIVKLWLILNSFSSLLGRGFLKILRF